MLPMIFGENLFDDLFNDAFERSMWNTDKALYGKRASQLMKTDVHETEEGYELNVELPGFSKDDIKIDIENDCLTISAERKFDDEDKKKNFVKRERFYGSYSRSFDVSGIDQEHIEAAYNDGVLTLTMPKKADTTPPTRRLEIK